MTVEDEIRGHAEEIECLRDRLGIVSVDAYILDGADSVNPVIVVDFNRSELTGYAARYFDFMFGLQRLFGREVDLWEKHMFENQPPRKQLRPVSLSVFRATA